LWVGVGHQAIDIQASESPAPIASNVAGSRPEPLALYAEMLALSRTLKLLMIAQLMLLLFLGYPGYMGSFFRTSTLCHWFRSTKVPIDSG
jgi:hypothetical protein